MSLTRKIAFRLGIVLLLVTSFVVVQAVYVPTNRDTKEPPETVTYTIEEPTEMELLYETTNFKYYFRETRDTIAIYDKRNGYTWKTGTDLEYAKDIDDECDDMLDLYEEQFENVDMTTFGDFVFTTTTSSEASGFYGDLVVKVNDIDASSTADAVMLQLDNVALTQNEQYRISFDGYGLQAKSVQVVLGTDVDQVIALTTTDDTYTIDFTYTGVTGNVSLMFYMGNVEDDVTATSVYLDNLMVEEFDGTDVVPDTNQVVRGDFDLLDTELTTSDDDLLGACRPKEVRLNTTYTGFANSLVTIEYYDLSNNIKRVSSASHEDVESNLFMVNNDDSHYRLDIDFEDQDIEISIHIHFDDNGIQYEVRDDEVTGDGTDVLAAIIISPFMGASGGAYEEFDIAELDYADEEVYKYKVPGYSLVPDGSGTLIRFNDNDVKLDPYIGQVYGPDLAQNELHYNFPNNYVDFKQPSMPVYGMAHGNEQAAFVAYATSGEEYMQIIAMPEENLTYYNFTYPRFEYNKMYLQVYNKMGWGYLTLYEDRNHFDINMRYDFLAGDGSTGPSADYVGMAKQYRNYLLDNDLLHEMTATYDDIPLHLDFMMNDSEKGVIGFINQVTTTTDGVDRILTDLMANDITNINAGMIGWDDGGRFIGDPRKADFTREIGRKGDFKDLIEAYQALGVDLSFQDEYYAINEDMMPTRRNAAKHTNTWYPYVDIFTEPVDRLYFARPARSVEWMLDHAELFDELGVTSYSVEGITSNLISDYTNDTTREMSKQILIDGFAQLNPDHLVNAYTPNSFLWAYTDRFIWAPVYGTQFLIETDTVPFLQLVLQGTMEMYGPYSNFSFYTDSDVLRMIDYNIYPNFILTEEPAHLLTDTMSRNFYTTQYELYEELIVSIYSRVNGALSSVIGADWVDRTVVENGVIVNSYSNGIEIVINYKNEAVIYNGVTVQPVSVEVVGE